MMGDSGRARDEMMISGGRSRFFLLLAWWMLVFILFVEGNIVMDEA